MTKPVRYRKGCLFQDHGAWFVRYREPVRQKDGSVKFRRQAKRLGDVDTFPRVDDVEPLRIRVMQKINHDHSNGDSSMTLAEFVEYSYLPWVESERRASTSKGYRELWMNHMSARIGALRVRRFAPFTSVACCARLPQNMTWRKIRFSISNPC
jgi:hypothetical protein